MSPLLRWLDSFLAKIARPFARADTLEVYSRRGYWFFGGILLVTLTLALLGFGYLDSLYGQAPASTHPWITKILSTLKLDFLPVSTPAIILLIVVFVTMGSIKRIQIWVGERLTSLAFRLMEAIVSLGEQCIERRGVSSILILILISLLAWGFSYEIEKTKREHLLRQNFSNWMNVAERFVEQNTVTKLEINEYSLVNEYWKQDFSKILELPGGRKHPALFLHQIIDLLYSNKIQGSFQQFLRSKTPELEKIVSECNQTLRPPEKRSLDEDRAWDLINIQMGRIYNRLSEKSLSEGNPTEKCDQCESDQRTALKYFKTVRLDKSSGNIYLSAVHNGQGTVYTNLFTSSLIWKRAPKTDDLCGGDAIQCAVMALEEYQRAGEGFERCSFQDLRRLNNITDLMSRIAVVYDKIVDQNSELQKQEWMANKKTLADQLGARVKEIMGCNANGVFISSVFLTAAQGYAAAAGLSMPEDETRPFLLQSAGMYTRIAHSYEPDNLQDWELFYFCPVLEGHQLHSKFVEEISRPDGLGVNNINVLTHLVSKQCPRPTSR